MFPYKQKKQSTSQVIVVHIQGNIGVGKSSIMDAIEERIYLFHQNYQNNNQPQQKLRIVKLKERVNDWQNYQDINLLDKMYNSNEQDQQNQPWKLAFQLNAMNSTTTDLLRVIEEAKNQSQILLVLQERSIESCQQLFIPLTFPQQQHYYIKDQLMTLCDTLKKQFPDNITRGHILINAPIEVQQQRILNRNRKEELGIQTQYLQTLDELHQEKKQQHFQPLIGEYSNQYDFLSANYREKVIDQICTDLISYYNLLRIE